MDKLITLILHHGGSFERDEYRKIKYVGGEVDVWKNINPDKLSLFDIEDKVKQCRGYNNIIGLYYLKPYKGVKLDHMNICLRSLITDNHRIDMLNVARSNDRGVNIYFEHSVIKEHQFLPPKPQQQEHVIVEPTVIQTGTVEVIGTEASNIVHHKEFQPMKYAMRDPIPVSFSGFETGSGSRGSNLWHCFPPPPKFPPLGFSNRLKSPSKREPPPRQMRGSMGLIPASSPDCEIGSESREQESWHFLPPPPGFKPKKIPPPPGFSGKEYN